MKSLLPLSPLVGALVVALVASSLGCILLVSPSAGSGRCHFRGEETSCGRCLATRCQARIDEACFDESVLSPMEQCAETGAEACDRVPPSGVASCMQAQCGPLCYPRTGTSQTRCVDSFVTPDVACSCAFGVAQPNERACNPEVYPMTLCCAPPAWPSPAVECVCNAISCVPSSTGCICTLTDNREPDAAEECKPAPEGHCCALGDRCECIAKACSGAQREVPFCNKAELRCPRNTAEVSSCSIRQ